MYLSGYYGNEVPGQGIIKTGSYDNGCGGDVVWAVSESPDGDVFNIQYHDEEILILVQSYGRGEEIEEQVMNLFPKSSKVYQDDVQYFWLLSFSDIHLIPTEIITNVTGQEECEFASVMLIVLKDNFYSPAYHWDNIQQIQSSLD